jgi:hypothetical protein
MKRILLSVLTLAASFLVSVPRSGAADLTLLRNLVQFDFVGQERFPKFAITLYPGDPLGEYRVTLKPNGPTATACPVWATGDQPQARLVLFTAPGQQIVDVRLKSFPNEPPPGQLRRCALTYSIVPSWRPYDVFGGLEIGIPYQTRD